MGIIKRLTAAATAGAMLMVPAVPVEAGYSGPEEIAFALRPMEQAYSPYTVKGENEATIGYSLAGGATIRFGMYIESAKRDMSYLQAKVSSGSSLVTFTEEGYFNPTDTFYEEAVTFTAPDGSEFSTKFKPYCLGVLKNGSYSSNSLGVLTAFSKEDNSFSTNWTVSLSDLTGKSCDFFGKTSDEYSFIEFNTVLDKAITPGDYTISFATESDSTYIESTRDDGGYDEVTPSMKNATIHVVDDRGDVDRNGGVLATDASQILVYAAIQGAGQTAYLYSETDAAAEAAAKIRADVDCSGSINANDASLILVYAAIEGSGGNPSWGELTGGKPGDQPTEPPASETTTAAATTAATTTAATSAATEQTTTAATAATTVSTTATTAATTAESIQTGIIFHDPEGILTINSLPAELTSYYGNQPDLTGLKVSLDHYYGASGHTSLYSKVDPRDFPDVFEIKTEFIQNPSYENCGMYIVTVSVTDTVRKTYQISDEYGLSSFGVRVLAQPETTTAQTTAVETTSVETTAATTAATTETTTTTAVSTTTTTEAATTAATEQTSTETTAAPELGQSYKLDVKCILQNDSPALPTGCEATALAIALNYDGFNVTKNELASKYLPKMVFANNLGADCDYLFPGDPTTGYGYGCYAPAIKATADAYFTDIKNASWAENISGSSFEQLLAHVRSGRPVVFNGTMGMIAPGTGGSWKTPDGKTITWKNNEHCLVLTGYDLDKNIVYVADPLKGNTSYSLSTVKQRYEQMGKSAVIIHPSLDTSMGAKDLENGAVYTLKNAATGKFMTAGGNWNGANIYQAPENSGTTQKFRLTYRNDTNAYILGAMISSEGKNRVLDVVKICNTVAGGCNVEMYDPIDNIAQEFVLVKQGDGTYIIASRITRSVCIAVSDSADGSDSGTGFTNPGNIVMQSYTGALSQRWILTKADTTPSDPPTPPTETTAPETTTAIATTTAVTTTETTTTSTTEAATESTAATTAGTETTTVSTDIQRVCKLEVKSVLQYDEPALPTGCEAAVLAAALNYDGYSATKNLIAERYLPKMSFTEKYGADYHYVFPGDPANEASFGCYIPCMAAAADAYFTANKSAAHTESLIGANFEDLYQYIREGRPVAVIATKDMVKPEGGTTWTAPDGETITWIRHAQAFLMTGYDLDAGKIYAMDTVHGNVSFDLAAFKLRYEQLGKNAMVLRPSTESKVGTAGIRDGGIYTLKNSATGKYLTVTGSKNGCNAYQDSEKKDSSQQFRVSFREDANAYVISPMNQTSGLVLDVVKVSGCVTGGCNVEIYAATDKTAQEFVFVPQTDGSYVIASRSNRTACVAVSSPENGSEDGTGYKAAGNAVIQHINGNAEQKWILELVSGETPTTTPAETTSTSAQTTAATTTSVQTTAAATETTPASTAATSAVTTSVTTAASTTTTAAATSTTEPSTTAAIDTSPVTGSKKLDVKCILQNEGNALPTGCEATALAIALNYDGFAVTKNEIADSFLPKMAFVGEIGGNFSYVFPGSPYQTDSYGCYEPAIRAAAEAYFTAQKNGSTVETLTGHEFEDLLAYVRSGRPVIFTATSEMCKPETGITWQTPDGSPVTWIRYQQTFVLTGYDMDKGVVYVADTDRGITTYELSTVKSRYNQMGRSALVIHPSSETITEAPGIKSGAIYTLKNVGSEKFLTLTGTKNQSNVYQYTETSNRNQQFRITYRSESNSYVLGSVKTDIILDVVKTGGCVTGGCNVQAYAATDAQAQEFVLKPTGSGTYVLYSRSTRSACLAVTDKENGSSIAKDFTSNGNAVMENYTGSLFQQWILTEVTPTPAG